jgi:hypothetical protein
VSVVHWSRSRAHVAGMLSSTDDASFLQHMVKAVETCADDIEASFGKRVACVRDIRHISLNRGFPSIAINIATGSLIANPDFIRAWVKSAADLGFLILHERGHLILNYIAATRGVTGFEEDAIINTTAIPRSGSDLVSRLYLTRAMQGAPQMLLLQGRAGLCDAFLWSDSTFQVGPWEQVRDWHRSVYQPHSWCRYSITRMMALIQQWREAIPTQARSQPPSSAPSGGGTPQSGQSGERLRWNSDSTLGKGPLVPEEGQGESGESPEGTGNDGPSEGYGSGDSADEANREQPLGHEPANDEQAQAHAAMSDRADKIKTSTPDAFTPEGSPTGDSEDVSFATLHVPPEAGLVQADLHGTAVAYLDNSRASANRDGVSLTTLLTTTVGGASAHTVMAQEVPSALSARDATCLAMGGIPSMWEHSADPEYTQADMYLDFSGSMEEYWGLCLAVADALRFKVRHVEGFATRCKEAQMRSGGISVGGGTNLLPVLKTMDDRKRECVIWVTDLGFAPGTYSREGVSYLNFLLGRSVKRLIICIPCKDVNTFSVRDYMAHYFSKLNAAARACVSLHPVTPSGGTA